MNNIYLSCSGVFLNEREISVSTSNILKCVYLNSLLLMMFVLSDFGSLCDELHGNIGGYSN